MKRRKEMSFWEVITDTARQKAEAARGHARGTPPGVERPRDVFLAACEQIAKALEPQGYVWTKSQKAATRKAGDLRLQVWFQPSHNSIAGKRVTIWIHALVLSPRMKQWRKTHLEEAYATGYVAGGQIGNLVPERSWMQWDVADPGQRQGVIADAIDAVRAIALPYLARFEDLPALVATLRHSELPEMSISAAIEFLHCFADKDSAEQCGKAFLRRNPEFVADYRREVLSLTPNVIGRGTYSQRLAVLARMLGLDFTP